MSTPGMLVFFCGKMAAGKSTLARELAQRRNAVLIVQDDFLARLFPGGITDVATFVTYSSRLREALAPLVCDLLSKGMPVVLDFPGNTRAQRGWFRQLFERAHAAHELHYIDAPDDVCKRQLQERGRHLPAGAAWTTEAEFDAITAYFQPPADEEGFKVIRHEHAG